MSGVGHPAPTLPNEAQVLRTEPTRPNVRLGEILIDAAIMKRFIEGETRTQVTLLPECLDDYVAKENTVRVVDVFVD